MLVSKTGHAGNVIHTGELTSSLNFILFPMSRISPCIQWMVEKKNMQIFPLLWHNFYRKTDILTESCSIYSIRHIYFYIEPSSNKVAYMLTSLLLSGPSKWKFTYIYDLFSNFSVSFEWTQLSLIVRLSVTVAFFSCIEVEATERLNIS